MSTPRTLTDSDFKVTPSARAKVTDLLKSAEGEAKAVRIFVSGGGCSGMNYGMTFAEQVETLDSVMTGEDGFNLVIDPVALGFLAGSEVDYVDDGVNTSFVFNDVFQAVGGSGTCGGCGGGSF